ncbi:MAG: hypothetical protein RL660_813 [Bacteroidota bacterium]|jgi:uncharacterized membrane protein
MEGLSINTPALLFPAITLLMLAFTNRFLVLASRVRKLHDEYNEGNKEKHVLGQIKNLRSRLNLIRYMQGFCVASFLGSVICMLFIFRHLETAAYITFAISLLFLILSILLSLLEINMSTRAIELELSDIEELIGQGNIIKDIFKRD